MTADARTVLQEALSLPDDDRADIAAELLASLDEAVDDPETVQTLWGEELEKRTRRVLSGQVAEEDWQTVRQRIADELTR
ncbi:MAG TPA: addiction module protein [Acidimicrobiales bacterium]|nr:addiction module protein [Acidimicrobiales bacterium]